MRAQFLKSGIESLKNKRKSNVKQILSKQQREELVEILKNQTPDQLGLGEKNSYWTTAILGTFIRVKYHVQYQSKTSYYLLFKESKFSYHKPGKVYERRDEKKVEDWKLVQAGVLNTILADENKVLLCEDEMILSSQTTFQKVWLKSGEYPKIEVSNTKVNRSLYGFLDVKTGKEYAFKTLTQNMFVTVECLKKIREIYPHKEIIIYWDGAGWHRGSAVKEYMQQDGRISSVYFPPYSPEENPQEHVWKMGRKNITHNKFISDIDEKTDEFITYLNNNCFKYKFQDFYPV